MRLPHLKCLAGCFILIVSFAACSSRSKTDDTVSPEAAEVSVAAGKVVYEQHCLVCHLASGKGAPPMNPPLAGTSFVLGDKAKLISIVTEGMAGTAVDGVMYKNVMPGFAFLTDQEIADVLTYIRNSFGNQADQVTAAEVAQLRPTE